MKRTLQHNSYQVVVFLASFNHFSEYFDFFHISFTSYYDISNILGKTLYTMMTT